MGFGIMAAVGNAFINFGEKIAREAGYRKAVTCSSHTIGVKMVNPNADEYAWDPDMYRYSNLFVAGYSNPIKPKVDVNKDLKDPDTVDVAVPATEGEEHVDLISSGRYGQYMRQDLISQLLNPQEQWRLILYGIIAVGALSLVTAMASLSAAGMF